jgi:serine/threonine protein kinase/Flp pilus assembly protein TadD
MVSEFGLIWVLKIMSKDFTSGADPEQLRQLFSLGLGETPSEQDIDRTASLDIFMEKPGGRIGRYKLVSVLGEGGMGIVYLAQQHHPMKRQVAVKIIKPGMDSKRVIARFEAERQALALLDHPNIAHIYDAGTTEAGRPYFVMEFVKGLPITEHCDRHKLTIKERLRLFQQVCQAVQHAHQKGIIHRDIKPSNILVSLQADQSVPKIIDFGVAKALAQPLTERTLATEDSQLLGTPEYMSPEQADMAIEDIDTRSDIYSLGVLLYVLLTGVLPFDSDTLRTGGIEQIRRIICETDPKTPSTRLAKLGDEARKLAENRRTEIAALAKCLHRELESIPLKAMRKDRSERYRSASELADDIENYLNGEPLIAVPPGTGYKLKKFVRRNRVLVSGITIVLVVLIAGIVVSTILAIGQTRARSEAQLIADFLKNDVLGSADKAKVDEATVSFMLDAASSKLPIKFKDKPLIEASICRTLAETYRQLGEYEKAEEHFLHATQIYREQLGPEHSDTLGAEGMLTYVYEDQGRYRDMERLCTRILAIEQRKGHVPSQISTRNGLGAAYLFLGEYEDAARVLEVALELEEGWHEKGGKSLMISRYVKGNLARVYTAQGRYEEAERLFAKTEYRAEGISYGLASLYREQGRYSAAETLFTRYLEDVRQLRGDECFVTVWCMNCFAQLYIDQDRYEEAKTLLDKALPIARRRMRPDHPVTLDLVNARAVLYTKQKEYDQAEKLLDEALKGRQLELGDDHPEILETINDLGILHSVQKHYEQAEKLLTEALEKRKAKLGPDHPHTLQSMHELAVLYREQGRYDEAERLFKEVAKGRHLKLGDTHPHTQQSLNELIDLYEAWNKPEKANEWRTKLPPKEATRE